MVKQIGVSEVKRKGCNHHFRVRVHRVVNGKAKQVFGESVFVDDFESREQALIFANTLSEIKQSEFHKSPKIGPGFNVDKFRKEPISTNKSGTSGVARRIRKHVLLSGVSEYEYFTAYYNIGGKRYTADYRIDTFGEENAEKYAIQRRKLQEYLLENKDNSLCDKIIELISEMDDLKRQLRPESSKDWFLDFESYYYQLASLTGITGKKEVKNGPK